MACASRPAAPGGLHRRPEPSPASRTSIAPRCCCRFEKTPVQPFRGPRGRRPGPPPVVAHRGQVNDPFTLSRLRNFSNGPRYGPGPGPVRTRPGPRSAPAPLCPAPRRFACALPARPQPRGRQTRGHLFLQLQQGRRPGRNPGKPGRHGHRPGEHHGLLNGCTDHSAAVVAKARERFPNNPVECIELPVNVGAPAARNWLLALPRTGKATTSPFSTTTSPSSPTGWPTC